MNSGDQDTSGKQNPKEEDSTFGIKYSDSLCPLLKKTKDTVDITSDLKDKELQQFVSYLLQNGVVFKEGAEGLEGSTHVKRSEMLRIIVQGNCEKFRLSALKEGPFPDVSINHPDALFIQLAKLRNIVRGYGHDGLYRPEQEISRAEALKVIMEATLSDGTRVFRGTSTPFKDIPWEDENLWYKNYISFAYEHGITYRENTFFRPDAPATKEDILYFLKRALEVAQKESL